MRLRENARFSTICIHAGQTPDPSTGAIITPIYQTSTYVQDGLGKHKGYEYARTQNPTRSALEANLAAIEGGKAGFCFASGMAATAAVLTLLQSGDHVVATANLYGGTYRLFEQVLRKYGLDFTYADTSRLRDLEQAIRPTTRLIFLETPTNPMLTLTDLDSACTIAHGHGIPVAVDNTFASPYVQQPIAFGADLIVHSTTKFLNGHSDSVGGAVVAVRDEHIEWLRFVQNAEGAIIGPMDAWLVLRGTKTLPVAHGAAQRERDGARRIPRGASGGIGRVLSRAGVASAARAGEAADARLRRPHFLSTRVARARPHVSRERASDVAR